jgi:hypothetical protein
VKSNTASATFRYQCDNIITSNPTINSITAQINGDYYAPISGVNVLYGRPVYNVTTVMTNMGTYYYKSPLLNYNSAPLSISTNSEVDATNITSGLTSGQFANQITCTNPTITSASLATIYTNIITMSGIANNVYGSSASVSATPISAIIDGPSHTLVYTTLAQTIQTLSSAVSKTGYRVSSATAGAANVPPFTASGTPYANTSYNNSTDITTTQEVQVSGGKFTTPSGASYSYQNYTSYYYNNSSLNTVNYSSIAASGYRYATFAWQIEANNLTPYGALSFTMTTTSAITVTNNLAYSGSSPIYLFYRIEDASSPTPTDASNLSTAWINGNSQAGTEATSGNYYEPDDYTSAPYFGLDTVSVNGTVATTFSVFIPPLTIPSGKTVNLYCRIGSPMATAFSYKYVSATLT